MVVEYSIKVVALGTVPENRRPGSSSAWLLLIFFVPVVGLPLFLLLGSPWVTGRRHRVQQQANAAVTERLADVPALPEGQVAGAHLASVLALNRRLTALPCVPGLYHRLLDEDGLVSAMTAAVGAAERSVFVQFYIMALDASTEPFFDALRDAVARGVRVRLLFDHLGARRYPGYRAMKQRLSADGVAWYPMMPIDPLRGRWRRPDLRNHRKLLVVDGERAFTGSQNLIDPTYLKAAHLRAGRRWVDLNVELGGPVVKALQAVFATDWYAEAGEVLADEIDDPDIPNAVEMALPAVSPASTVTSAATRAGAFQVVPSGPGFPTEPNLRLFTSLIHAATTSVSIVSPYFVPDEALEQAITTAAYRGVAVELFVSERADQFMVHHAQRSYYDPLLRAGVRIHCLPAPGVLHTKLLVVDSELAVIGSSNMDIRSFQLDYEVSLLGLEPTFVADLEATVDAYRAASFELTTEGWAQRSPLTRYLDNVMRLTAALQ
nr:phospholipase D-like domain-containing protein [Kineococcus vitellinus]